MVIHSVDAVNRPAPPEDLTAICTYGLFFFFIFSLPPSLPPTVSPSHRLSLSLTHSLTFLLSFAIGE